MGNRQGRGNCGAAELRIQGTAEPWGKDSQPNLGRLRKSPISEETLLTSEMKNYCHTERVDWIGGGGVGGGEMGKEACQAREGA